MSQNRFGVTPSQYNTYSVADCRGLVKTLVCGVKTITWGIVSCKAVGSGWSSVAKTGIYVFALSRTLYTDMESKTV